MKSKINKKVVELKYKRNQLNQKEFNLSAEVNHALDNRKKINSISRMATLSFKFIHEAKELIVRGL